MKSLTASGDGVYGKVQQQRAQGQGNSPPFFEHGVEGLVAGNDVQIHVRVGVRNAVR